MYMVSNKKIVVSLYETDQLWQSMNLDVMAPHVSPGVDYIFVH